MKYFKLVHAPTWKIPHYMTGFLSICTRHEAFGFFDCFVLSATLLCLVRYIFWKKMIFFMKCFKLVHAPTWQIPQYMNFFLFICTRHIEFGIFNFFALSATPYCFARYIILEKDDFFCMYKARRNLHLQQFSPICESLIPCTVHFLEKDDFSWNISSWCMPQLERFLNKWKFFYSFVQDIESSVSSTFMRYLRLPNDPFWLRPWKYIRYM